MTDDSIESVCRILTSIGMKLLRIDDRVRAVGKAVGINIDNPDAVDKLRRRAYSIHRSYWVNMLLATESIFEECGDNFPFVFIGDATQEDIVDGIISPVYVVCNKHDVAKISEQNECIIVCDDERLLKERLVKKVAEWINK